MLALFAFMGMESINTMNAYKTMLATICNGVAILVFLFRLMPSGGGKLR